MASLHERGREMCEEVIDELELGGEQSHWNLSKVRLETPSRQDFFSLNLLFCSLSPAEYIYTNWWLFCTDL